MSTSRPEGEQVDQSLKLPSWVAIRPVTDSGDMGVMLLGETVDKKGFFEAIFKPKQSDSHSTILSTDKNKILRISDDMKFRVTEGPGIRFLSSVKAFFPANNSMFLFSDENEWAKILKDNNYNIYKINYSDLSRPQLTLENNIPLSTQTIVRVPAEQVKSAIKEILLQVRNISQPQVALEKVTPPKEAAKEASTKPSGFFKKLFSFGDKKKDDKSPPKDPSSGPGIT